MGGMARPCVPMLLVFLALACPAVPAHGTGIHRCVAANGTPVFTDQPCSSLGDMSASAGAHGLRPPGTVPHFCPADRKVLEKRVMAAFRQHDPNALAGLMLWRGYGARMADGILRRLSRLVQQPLLGFAGEPATAASTGPDPPFWAPVSSSSSPPPPPQPLVLELGDPMQPSVSFAVAHRDGCLWLEPPAPP